MDKRLKALKDECKEKCDAVLIFSAADNTNSNLTYLTGIPKEVTGFLFWNFRGKPSLVVSDYYNALDSKPRIKPTRRKSKEHVYELIASSNAKVIGIEERYLSYAFVKKLRRKAKVRFVPIDGILSSIRAVKDKNEIKAMKKASKITKEAFYIVEDMIRPGITEKEIEIALVGYYLDQGDIAFRPIVASGRNSMYIHSRPTRKKIKPRETVIIDMGASYNGYCSDFTRTFLVEPKVKQLDMVSKLIDVWVELKEEVSIGMTGEEIYNLAREKLGPLSKHWPYALGHGVGLDVHETPSLGPKGGELLEGMVFTIEPGLHIPGIGGARFEDTGVLTKKGFVPLAKGF